MRDGRERGVYREPVLWGLWARLKSLQEEGKKEEENLFWSWHLCIPLFPLSWGEVVYNMGRSIGASHNINGQPRRHFTLLYSAPKYLLRRRHFHFRRTDTPGANHGNRQLATSPMYSNPLQCHTNPNHQKGTYTSGVHGNSQVSEVSSKIVQNAVILAPNYQRIKGQFERVSYWCRGYPSVAGRQ